MKVTTEEGRLMNSLPNFLRDGVKKAREVVRLGEEAERTGEATDEQVRDYFRLVCKTYADHFQIKE